MEFSPALVALARTLDTPVLILDPGVIRAKYAEITAAFPGAECFYAVKANPHPVVLQTLVACGAGFEVSSELELRAVLEAGAYPARVISSNPVKTPGFLRAAHAAGLDRFAFDSRAELEKIAELAPGSRVYLRLAVDNSGSEWPLSKKYGANSAEAVELFRRARALRLQPYGLTFHVGSQCYSKDAWVSALYLCEEIRRAVGRHGIHLEMVSLGGGLPVPHTKPVPHIDEIGRTVMRAARECLSEPVHLTVEPGRALVGEAAVLVASVIGKARRGIERWLYLDAGVFNALLETIEGFGYVLATERGGPRRLTTVAGPSCDSVDTMFTGVLMPDLEVGERVYILNAGAYTLSYASHFNGFPPPSVHVAEGLAQASTNGAVPLPALRERAPEIGPPR